MKILILTNKLPYPPRDGGSIVTLNMLKGLRDCNHQVTCLAMNTRKHPYPVEEIPEELRLSIRFLAVDCDTSVRPVRMLLNLLFSRQPYIATRFNLRNYRQRLTDLLQEETFDLIQLEGPYLGHYLNEIRERTRTRVALRAHNVEHLIWERKADHESSPLKHRYFRNLSSRLQRFEIQVVEKTDYLIPISTKDEEYFRKHSHSQSIFTIPAGLSLGDYPLTSLPSDLTIFFIGALDWLPNQEGLSWFLDQVFEELVTEFPRLRFHVAGRNAPIHMIDKLSHERIIFHGEVEDAIRFMQSYRVMVAPLLTGSGIRVKILEAMALGRPVVTSSVGIEGIPAENNVHFMVADEPDLFRNQLVKLLTPGDEVAQMVTRARQLITHNFDTFTLSSRLSQFFKTQE